MPQGTQGPGRPADTGQASSASAPLSTTSSTGPPPDDRAAEAPVEAGLRLIADRLDVPAAVLFRADPAGALTLLSAVGTWGGDADALQVLAEMLGRRVGVLDGSGVIEGARFAAGARLGDGEGALLVLAPDDRHPTDAWTRAFATSAQAALGLVRAAPLERDPAQVLHDVSTHPGSFEDRLALALERAAATIGLDAAVFALIEDGQWRAEASFDPSNRLVPVHPVPLLETFCAVTVRTDGPFAVEDAAATSLGIDAPASYLGAPVYAGGRCVGTFSVVGHRAVTRTFSEAARGLVDALARWVGGSLQGRAVARDLADREADLSAFFDAAPMGMGVARLDGDDIEFVRVNAAAAAWLGSEPAAVAGRTASELGVGGRFGRAWVEACRASLAAPVPAPFEATAPGPDGPRALATTVARIADADDGRFSFVVEDVTASRQSQERAREGEAQMEAVMAHAPVALFAADAHGRLAMSRGRILDRLGLDPARAAGRDVAELFAEHAGAAEAIAEGLAGGQGVWTVEVGGDTFEVRVMGRQRNGAPAGLIGVALDVTERQDALRVAEAAAETQKGLLKQLQHEIRSPLTSILGYADLLDGEMTAEEVDEVRDVIARSGERLLGALDELVRLGEEAVPQPVPTRIGSVLIDVLETIRPAAEARRIALNVWCTVPDEPVLVDPALFVRIVRHLVSGAVATAQATRVDVRLEPDARQTVRLTVTGGVPSEMAGMGSGFVPKLAEALGGSARRIDGDARGWAVRLPRRAVPLVELPERALAPPAGPPLGEPGEAPAMAAVPVAA